MNLQKLIPNNNNLITSNEPKLQILILINVFKQIFSKHTNLKYKFLCIKI